MLKSKYYIVQLFYLLLFTQFVGMMRQAGMNKYVVYSLFLVPLIFLGNTKIRLRSACILIPPLVYITMGLVSNAASGFFDFFSTKNAILMVFPAVFAIILYEKGLVEGLDICRTVFLSYVLYNILFYYQFNIAESTRSFPFGIFFIYFIIKKDWPFCVFAAVMCVFTQKRIALLGMAAVLCFVILAVVLTKYCKLKKKHLWITCCVIGVVMAYAIAGMTQTGKLVELFELIGFDPTGRQTIWKAIRPMGDFSPFFTGNGLGFATSKLDEMRVWMRDDYWFTNLHSDFYTGFLELGFTGFGVWILSYFWSFFRLTNDADDDNNGMIFALAAIVYTFIIYITDNILVYFEYWFPLNLMLLDMAYSGTAEKKRQDMLFKAHTLHD